MYGILEFVADIQTDEFQVPHVEIGVVGGGKKLLAIPSKSRALGVLFGPGFLGKELCRVPTAETRVDLFDRLQQYLYIKGSYGFNIRWMVAKSCTS